MCLLTGRDFGLWCRANVGLRAFVSGSMFTIPHIKCDTLQLWFTGDEPVCSEGQAKSSGAFVDAPATFRYSVFTMQQLLRFTGGEAVRSEGQVKS